MQFLKILIISTFFSSAFSQISFFKTYSNGGFDRGEGVVQLPDSGYLITGSSSSFNANSKQAFIMRVDSLGNFKWSKDYGGSEADKGRRIFHVENDGIYVIGQTNSFGNSFHDAYFFKTDLEGNLLFENRYGGVNYEDIYDAVMLKDTSFIAVGVTNSTLNEVENVYILRINKFGERLWTKSIGSNFPDWAKSIKIYDDTTVFIVGEMYDELFLKQRGMLMKMHINGTVHWTQLFGDETRVGFNDLNITNDTIRVVGYVYNEFENDRSNLYMSSHLLDGTFIKKNVDYLNGEYIVNHILSYENNYLMFMSVKNDPIIPTYEDGLIDASCYFYNSEFIYLNNDFKFSNIGEDLVNQVISSNDGGVLVIGYNEVPNIGGNNVMLVKIGAKNYFTPEVTGNVGLVSIKENEAIKSSKIYPNPVNSILNIDSDNLFKAKIFNSIGELIFTSNMTKIDVSNLDNGVYFIELTGDNFKTTEKIIIQH
jgi:hypothetical protein